MDFIDPKKRRSHSIRLFIGYGLVGVALLLATTLLAMYTYGFDFNRKTGTIIQNGLVFVDSHPVSADIYLNSVLKDKTAARLVIKEGQYNIELRSKGYRTWKKDISLAGSQIERLVYPLLFPEKLITKDSQQYPAVPGFASQSPDRHWLVVQKTSSLVDFEVTDLTTTTNTPEPLKLPAALFTTATGLNKIELAEWSNDNRHFMIKHTYPTGSEYVMVDRQTPADSVNLSKFYVRPTQVFSLKDKKYDQYYIHDRTALTLASADLKQKTVTPLLSGVLSFKSYGSDTVLYFSNAGVAADKEMLTIATGSDTYALREIAKNDDNKLEISRFDNHWYVVATSILENRTFIFKDPQGLAKQDTTKKPAPVAALKLDNPRFVSFSANSRFIYAQSGSSFVVYDAEETRLFKYDTKLAVTALQQATWMDGHRLSLNSDGKLVIFEFDGANMQTLNAANAGFLPFFDRDYKALFTVGQSVSVATNSALNRTELRVTN